MSNVTFCLNFGARGSSKNCVISWPAQAAHYSHDAPLMMPPNLDSTPLHVHPATAMPAPEQPVPATPDLNANGRPRTAHAKSEAVAAAKAAIEKSFQDELPIEAFANIAHMHPDTFTRHFRRRFGVSPVTYRLHCRLKYAVELATSHPELSIRKIAQMAGFKHLSYFHRQFQKFFHCTPATMGGRRPGAEQAPDSQTQRNGPGSAFSPAYVGVAGQATAEQTTASNVA